MKPVFADDVAKKPSVTEKNCTKEELKSLEAKVWNVSSKSVKKMLARLGLRESLGPMQVHQAFEVCKYTAKPELEVVDSLSKGTLPILIAYCDANHVTAKLVLEDGLYIYTPQGSDSSSSIYLVPQNQGTFLLYRGPSSAQSTSKHPAESETASTDTPLHLRDTIYPTLPLLQLAKSKERICCRWHRPLAQRKIFSVLLEHDNPTLVHPSPLFFLVLTFPSMSLLQALS